MRIRNVSLVLLLVFSCHAFSQVNRCESVDGEITYTNSPCDVGSLSSSHVDINENVLNHSGARATPDSREVIQNENFHTSGNVSSRFLVNSGETLSLMGQKEFGAELLDEAREVVDRAPRIEGGSRSSRLKYADQLRRSASILMSSTRVSREGVRVILEANTLAEQYSLLPSSPSRQGIESMVLSKQRIAAVHLGSEDVNEEDQERSPPAPVNTFPMPDSAPHPQPSVITSCDSGGCWDNLGNRYNRGGGTNYIPASGGGSCRLVGGFMHCP